MIKFCQYNKEGWISIGYHKDDQKIEIVPFEFISQAEHIFLIKPGNKAIPRIPKDITCNGAYLVRDVSAQLAATATAIILLRSLPTTFTARTAAQMSELQMRSIVRRNNLKVAPILFNDKFKPLLRTCLELISKES